MCILHYEFFHKNLSLPSPGAGIPSESATGFVLQYLPWYFPPFFHFFFMNFFSIQEELKWGKLFLKKFSFDIVKIILLDSNLVGDYDWGTRIKMGVLADYEKF